MAVGNFRWEVIMTFAKITVSQQKAKSTVLCDHYAYIFAKVKFQKKKDYFLELISL